MNSRAQPVCYLPLTPALRRRLEATIEQLIGLLDEIDGASDLESDSDSESDAGTEHNGDEAEEDWRDLNVA
jgi:hypothetical protein